MKRFALFLTCALFTAHAHALPPYSLAGSFELPAAVSAYDVLPDGRCITIVGDDIHRQNVVNGSTWTRIGSVSPGLISPFGASFVRVSPDGSAIALGDNNFGPGAMVHVLNAAALNPATPTFPSSSWASSNLDAHWHDSTTLFVTGASAGGEAALIDLASHSSRLALTNIGLSAAGIATHGGRLFAGNGFDLPGGPSSTGEVRAFDLDAVLSSPVPIDFTAGLPVAAVLSAASLGFDPLGNLLVGGGDVFGGSNDFGYAAVIDAAAIADAIAGGPIVPPSAILQLTPDAPTHSYFTRFNSATDELLVTFFDNSSFTPGTTVYRYAIPAPASAAIVLFALAPRRRRRVSVIPGARL